jgi:hypothetical protein
LTDDDDGWRVCTDVLVWTWVRRFDRDSDDEDVDGKPMEDLEKTPERRGVKRSRGDRASSDSDSDGGNDDLSNVDIFGDSDQSENHDKTNGQGAVKWTEQEEEERRAMLRKLETNLLHLRDELEGKMAPDDLDAKLQAKRQETIEAWEKVREHGHGVRAVPVFDIAILRAIHDSKGPKGLASLVVVACDDASWWKAKRPRVVTTGYPLTGSSRGRRRWRRGRGGRMW